MWMQLLQQDVVKGKCEALSYVWLQTVTEESATVHTKTEVKLTLANISVSDVFTVADIVDEVIIGADFTIAQDTNLSMGQQVLS